MTSAMSLLSQQSAVGFADLGKERRQLLRPAKNTGTLEPIRLFERVRPEGSSLAQRISVHHRAVKPVMLWRLGFWNSSKIAIKHGPRARLNKLIRPFDCSLAFLFNLLFSVNFDFLLYYFRYWVSACVIYTSCLLHRNSGSVLKPHLTPSTNEPI